MTFEVADLYRWQPPAAYDVVFFSFLLTHVPSNLATSLWQLVSSGLADGGTAAFLDAAPNRHDEEDWLAPDMVRRTLRDGSEYRIVKVFPTPSDLVAAMAEHGLDATVDVVNDDFLVGTGGHRRLGTRPRT